MAVKLSPLFNDAQLDSSGNPLSGGKLYTYAAGSTTLQTAYQDSAGSTPHTNPIALNARGEPPAPIWLTAGSAYKFDLQTAASVSIRTIDNVSGVNDTTSAIDQWVPSGLTPTYVSATSFTLSGDQTSAFHPNRRLKSTNSGGTVYSTISASSYSGGTGLTTVTVVNDSGSLDSGLSAVSYGLVSKTNDSLPRQVFPTIAQMKGFINGLTYANNAGDATNDIDIAAGQAVDSTGAYVLSLAATLTKRLDASWAVGTNQGGLDTGSIGNSDYYIWLIGRSDTGVIDALFSLSSTAPTMPTGYDYKRLIGWFKRVGATIVAFHTYETEGGGIEMNWDTPTTDVTLANTLTTARRTDAVKVPLNFSVIAHVNASIEDNSSTCAAWIYCPDQADLAPNVSAAPVQNTNQQAIVQGSGNQLFIRTSATGTIAARANIATVDVYVVSTMGFRWARRN